MCGLKKRPFQHVNQEVNRVQQKNVVSIEMARSIGLPRAANVAMLRAIAAQRLSLRM